MTAYVTGARVDKPQTPLDIAILVAGHTEHVYRHCGERVIDDTTFQFVCPDGRYIFPLHNLIRVHIIVPEDE